MATTYLHQLRLLSREVRLFLVTTALVGLVWDGMRVVLLNLYLRRLGYGSEFIGLVNAAGGYAFAAGCLPAALLGARWTSGRLIVLGVALTASGLLLFSLGQAVPVEWQHVWLPATYVLAYGGLALYYVHSLPFLMSTSGPGERQHAFAAHIALGPLSAFVGGLLAGVLPGWVAGVLGVSIQDPAAYRYPLFLAGLLLVPAALVLLPARGAGPIQVRADLTPHDRPPYALILVVALIVGLRFAGRSPVVTFFNVYMDDALGAPTGLIGALVAVAQLVSVPAALAAPLVVARWGSRAAVGWGSLVMALTLLPLALVPTWFGAGLGLVGSTMLMSLTTGPVRVFSQEVVVPSWWATMSSAVMIGSGLSSGTMALAGGFLIAAVGYRSLFLAGGVLCALGALIFAVYFRVPRGELATLAAPEGSG